MGYNTAVVLTQAKYLGFRMLLYTVMVVTYPDPVPSTCHLYHCLTGTKAHILQAYISLYLPMLKAHAMFMYQQEKYGRWPGQVT